MIKKHPDKDLFEIEQILRKEPDIVYRDIPFNKDLLNAVSKACLHKQKELSELVVEILQDWLRKNYYI